MTVLRNAVVGLALALALASSLAFAGEPSINVIDPWIQEAPPAAKVLAAYMTLHNTGDQALVVTGVSSEQFGRVEIHATEMSGDMARMVHKDSIAIPPQARFALAPGGYHLMLMEPRQPLRAGDHANLTLSFRNGKQLTLDVEVRKAAEAMDHSSHTGGSHGKEPASPMQHKH